MLNMKRIILFLLLIFVVLNVNAQFLVKNSDNPMSKNAGREVKIKEVMRIEDVEDDFFFKYPYNLKIASNGSIFISDREQLLQFTPEGKLIRNYYKKGQGPGEFTGFSNYLFVGENIIIHNRRPSKMVLFNLNGKYIKEFRIKKSISFLGLKNYYKNTFYFFSFSIPIVKGESAIVDIPQDLIAITDDGQNIKKMISFPIKQYVAIGKHGSRGAIGINNLISVTFRNKYLFINHTQEYLIKLYDIEKNRVVLQFKRKYDRVKTSSEKKKKKTDSMVMVDRKRTTAPKQKYLNDIKDLFVNEDCLWVLTSTKHDKKGCLLDIFNHKGQYIDCFYMKVNGKIMAINDNYLFVKEKDEDENPFIVKYRMIK